jgi:NADPH:quinone reductase-like Zn-dependent oxidoreductase
MPAGAAQPEEGHVRAAFIERRGPADEIKVGDQPVPEMGPADVLVQVEAVAVNQVDTFVRSGSYPTPLPFPFVIGRDLVGTVVARGPGVAGFQVGDRVWSNSLGHGGRQGAAAEFATVGAARAYPVPTGLDPAALVAVVHPAATAYLALHVHGELRSGDTVLVAGAAGHVGRAATVMAARAGARVVATAGVRDLDLCRDLGADVVVDYRHPDLVHMLAEVVPDGVDLHLDTSGRHDLAAVLTLMAPRGRIVVMAGLDARPLLPVGPLYTRDIHIVGFAISNASTPDLAAAARRINQLVVDGVLDAGPVEVLPLSAAANAHRRIERGEVRGTRLVLVPSLD